MGRVWRKLVKKLRRQRVRRHGKMNEAQEAGPEDDGEEEDPTISKDSPVNPTFFLSEEKWKARDELEEAEALRRVAEEERLLRVEQEQRERIRREWEVKEKTDQAEKTARLEEDKQKRQARLHVVSSINLCGWTAVVKDIL